MGGIDWNRSPVATFQTSHDGGGPAESDHPFARYDDGGYVDYEDYFDELDYGENGEGGGLRLETVTPAVPRRLGGHSHFVMGVALETFVIWALISVVLVLVLLVR